MATLAQRSFSGGELAPTLYGRTDTVKYATGARTLRNMFVQRHGGAASRPGGKFVAEVKDSTKAVRLIPFQFNDAQTYCLEFGDQYMRVHQAGVQLTDLTLTITGVTQANPAVVTYTGTDPVNGQEVFISGVVGMTQLNNRSFKIANVNGGANTFELQTLAGANINSTAFGAYSSGGTAKRVYEITTPYLEADLPELQFVQSADVVTIVHKSYAPRELSRTGHTSWTLALLMFEPEISRPTGLSVSAGGAGGNTYLYKVTAVDAVDFEESLAATEATQAITGITQANPAVVTYSGADSYNNGDEIYIASVVGMTEVNGLVFTVANVNTGANTFELLGVNSTTYTAYSSGGTVAKTFFRLGSAAAPTGSAPHTITWTAVTAASEYNVYRAVNGVYGFIGVAKGTTFLDINYTPDQLDTPPEYRNPFNGTGDYPGAVSYFQQRLGLASTDNEPETMWLSRTAQFKNFTVSSPLQDDDAVTGVLAGREVNEIRHLIDIGTPLVLTAGGEHALQGGNGGVITPTEINPRQYSYFGANYLRPIPIGSNALFVQARGSIVRDLGFDYQVDGYKGNDLTLFSNHLFDGYELLDWSYQQIPHSVVWAVRDDGVMLGLTYVREQEVLAWTRHDTDGLYENVCTISEGLEDAVYVVVQRTIGGTAKRYIERFAQRRVDDIVDYIGMDSALSYDGRNTTPSHTMTLSGSGWTYTDTLTLTSSTAFFASSDVGNAIHLTGSDGTLIRATITAYTSTTVVSVTPHKTVPVAMQAVAISDWSKAVDEVSGLWHLEGKTVAVVADGFVVASPNNASYVARTISSGVLTLDKPYSVIHVGLPFTCDVETLNIDTVQGETLRDKKAKVGRLTIDVEETRGLFAGGRPPSDDTTDPLEGLYEIKIRSDEGYDDPVDLETGTIDIVLQGEFNSNGRVFIRQIDPLPATILAVYPEGYMAFRGG